MNDDDTKEFRLSNLIKKEIQSGKSYEQLARDIVAANHKHKDKTRKVDRRKLKRIIEFPEEIVLSMRELRALDAYFSPQGEGLGDKPIFERTRILDSMTEKGEVTFLLGSAPREAEQRNDLSRWDARSMACLLHDLGRLKVGLRYEIEDVLHIIPVDRDKAKSQSWHRLIDREVGPSLIAIGSPRACQATEVMLARMFGVAPFEKSNALSDKLPFYFVWSPEAEPSYVSRFTLGAEDLARIDLTLSKQVLAHRAWAFVLGKKPHGFQRQRAAGWKDMYGVIVAQRRSGGQVWLVTAGISGPTTYAAAQLVRTITHALPRPQTRGEHGRPMWVAVVAEVRINRSAGKGDNRVVHQPMLVGNPQIWDPTPA